MGFVYVLQMLTLTQENASSKRFRRLGAIGASPICSAAGECPCRS
jgi:hypothetical protein